MSLFNGGHWVNTAASQLGICLSSQLLLVSLKYLSSFKVSQDGSVDFFNWLSLPLETSKLVCRNCFTHFSTCFMTLPRVKAVLHVLVSVVITNFDTLDPHSGEEEERNEMRSQVINAIPKKMERKGEVMDIGTWNMSLTLPSTVSLAAIVSSQITWSFWETVKLDGKALELESAPSGI